MTTAAKIEELDFLAILFSGPKHGGPTDAELEAKWKAEDKAEHAARVAAEAAEKAKNCCPRCMGSGRIAQFTHRKGGECFLCGGSGLFAGRA